MDIVITGRHTEVPERFRRLAQERLAKVAQLAPKAHRADVELSHERNPRQSATCEKVEITLRGKGPVIRAEASAEDSSAALDLAFGKLLERLRRTHDRRTVHHGRQTPPSVRIPSATDGVAIIDLPAERAGDDGRGSRPDGGADPSGADPSGADPSAADPSGADQGGVDQEGAQNGDSPVVVRTKDHVAAAMTLDQALYEMELVGHDWFLFVDAESGRPSVVYRRRGWSYGMIRLTVDQAALELVGQPVG